MESAVPYKKTILFYRDRIPAYICSCLADFATLLPPGDVSGSLALQEEGFNVNVKG